MAGGTNWDLTIRIVSGTTAAQDGTLNFELRVGNVCRPRGALACV